MKNRMPLEIAFANVKQKINSAEIYNFIESQTVDIQTFWIDPEKTRGKHVKAAIEYLVIVNAAGSIAKIGEILWKAYDKFIGQKKTSDEDDGGIYISVKHPDGAQYNFWLGKDYKNREIFINIFTKIVEEIRNHPNALEKTEELMSSITHDELWIQRK